jgi:hypothetical protein
LRNRFPNPTSLKQHELLFKKNGIKFILKTVQYIYELIARKIEAVLKANVIAGPY